MTKAKTSREKLETRNETVKDLRSALTASRWKWREINQRAVELWSLIDHACGFCILALRTRPNGERRCPTCPEDVREFCTDLQGKNSKIMNAMDAQIMSVFEFLSGLKYDVN